MERCSYLEKGVFPTLRLSALSFSLALKIRNLLKSNNDPLTSNDVWRTPIRFVREANARRIPQLGRARLDAKRTYMNLQATVNPKQTTQSFDPDINAATELYRSVSTNKGIRIDFNKRFLAKFIGKSKSEMVASIFPVEFSIIYLEIGLKCHSAAPMKRA